MWSSSKAARLCLDTEPIRMRESGLKYMYMHVYIHVNQSVHENIKL